jgi:hypothetical protein
MQNRAQFLTIRYRQPANLGPPWSVRNPPYSQTPLAPQSMHEAKCTDASEKR